MADHTKIVVYLRAGDVRMLREHGQDVKEWTRSQVRAALAMERELHQHIGAPPTPVSQWTGKPEQPGSEDADR